MAHFKTVVTNLGNRRIAATLLNGEKINIIRAEAGSGRVTGDPAALTRLVTPTAAEIITGNMETGEGEAGATIQLPVFVTNKGQTNPLPVREVGLIARDSGGEFMLTYTWLQGGDTDNIIPVSKLTGAADTRHRYDIAIVLTNQEAANIQVEIGLGGMVTEGVMKDYAAPKNHTHPAAEITETTGETVEVAQRRQDRALQKQGETIEKVQEVLTDLETGTDALAQKIKDHTEDSFAHVQGADTTENDTFYGKKEGVLGFYPASNTKVLPLTLPTASWSEVLSVEDLYSQQVTQADVTALVKANKTIVNSKADITIQDLLAEQGVSQIWINNEEGRPVAYAKGAKPEVDILIQAQIVNF